METQLQWRASRGPRWDTLQVLVPLLTLWRRITWFVDYRNTVWWSPSSAPQSIHPTSWEHREARVNLRYVAPFPGSTLQGSPVGLIQDEDFDVTQLKARCVVKMVNQPAGCSNQNVRPCPQSHLLRLEVQSACTQRRHSGNSLEWGRKHAEQEATQMSWQALR